MNLLVKYAEGFLMLTEDFLYIPMTFTLHCPSMVTLSSRSKDYSSSLSKLCNLTKRLGDSKVEGVMESEGPCRGRSTHKWLQTTP